MTSALRMVVSVTVLLGIMEIAKTDGATIAENYKLVQDKMSGYQTQVRPVRNDTESLEVWLGFVLLSIIEVNEQDQTLVTSARLLLEWNDHVLKWNVQNYDGIVEMLLQQQYVWHPDIVLANSVSSQTELGYSTLQVRVNSNGTVTWEPTAMLETSCAIDITYYPFDTQVCSIMFMTAMSVESEVHVYIDRSNPIDISRFAPNGLWDLLAYSARNLGKGHFVDRMSKIEFKLQLQRRREFYILNIVLPILFLSVTSSLTFALPADSGEKMGLSITVLLAYAVYLTLVTEAMPSTSVQVSYLAVYLIILLALTALSVLLSVWILSYHHRNENRPVQGCLATVTVALGKLLCMSSQEGPSQIKNKGNSISPYELKRNAADKAQEIIKSDPLHDMSEDFSRENDKPGSPSPEARAVSGRQVAETFDRLIFIVFFLISTMSTVAIMLILWLGSVRQEESTSLSQS